MTEAIAANIKRHREERGWTQEHLAHAAEVNVRTVQRVEKGEGISAESLQAIAGAFDVSLEELRFDAEAALAAALGVGREQVTPELVEQKLAEFKARYSTLSMKVVESSGDIQRVLKAHALSFECKSEEEAVLDVSTDIEQYLSDLINIASELEPTQKREYAKDIFGLVQKLAPLGYVLCIGSRPESLRSDVAGTANSVAWTVLYGLVTRTAEAPQEIMIPRGRKVQIA